MRYEDEWGSLAREERSDNREIMNRKNRMKRTSEVCWSAYSVIDYSTASGNFEIKLSSNGNYRVNAQVAPIIGHRCRPYFYDERRK